MRQKSSIAVVLACALAPAGASQAAPPDAGPAVRVAPHPVVAGVAGAEATGVPPGVVLGTRMVFLSTQGARLDDGKRWDPKSEAGGREGRVSSTAVDVVAVEPGLLVLELRSYALPQGPQGPATYTQGVVGLAHASGGSFFLHPGLLGKVEPHEEEGTRVARETFSSFGNPRPALRSVTSHPQSMTDQVFDLESGVLLYARSMNGPFPMATGGTEIHTATHTFRGARDRALPWRTGKMPDWVGRTKRLQYRMEGVLRVQGLPDTPSGTYTIDYVRKQLGATWASYERTEVLLSMPVPQRWDCVSAVGSADGLFIDPAALAKLKVGQVLDQDPTLGEQVGVDYVGPGRNGRPVVAITVVSSTLRTTNVYDAADGRMVAGTLTRVVAGGAAGTQAFEWHLTGAE